MTYDEVTGLLVTLFSLNSGGQLIMDNIGGLIFLVVYLAVIIAVIAGMWKAYEKAGEPGWACIIPFYNFYVMCRIGGKPGWWLLLMLIPIVGLIVAIIVSLGVAENFGKRSRIWYWACAALVYLLAYPRLWRRSVPWSPDLVGRLLCLKRIRHRSRRCGIKSKAQPAQ